MDDALLDGYKKMERKLSMQQKEIKEGSCIST